MQKSPHTVIFGGTGFIGQHFAQSLIASNQKVSLSGSQQEVSKDALSACTHAFYLTHIGTSGGADASEGELAEMFNKNKTALEKAFHSVAKTVQNFIFISSGGTVYGKTKETPSSESDPLAPISAYGKVKKMQEELLHDLAKRAGVPYTILRPSNVYGSGQKNNLIGTIIQNLSQQKTIPIFGPRGVVRDFLYIDDLVNALSLLNLHSGEGETFNLGTGIATPTLEVVQELSQLLNAKPQLNFLPLRPGDVPYNVLNSQAFQQKYRWKCLFSIQDGLRLTATQRT